MIFRKVSLFLPSLHFIWFSTDLNLHKFETEVDLRCKDIQKIQFSFSAPTKYIYAIQVSSTVHLLLGLF